MKTFLVILMLVYVLAFIVIGLLDSFHVKDFKDYAVAGKKQTTSHVVMTLLATVIGGSLTIGSVNTAYTMGFPAIWWFAFGSIGLILQALFISKKVREMEAVTLPDLARKLVGPSAEKLLALIIVIAWIGVVAGQFVALSGLISYAIGGNSKTIFVVVSAIVIVYTVVGGQMSVVKTDMVQIVVIIVGMVVTCIYLFTGNLGASVNITDQVEFINDSYQPINLFTQLFIIGGVYFLGPDIMSRNFISKDGKTAKRSAIIAAIMLTVFGLFVVLIGIWAKLSLGSSIDASKVLMEVTSIIPKPLAIIMILGLLSAVLSSTDTCIINASSIFVKDILGKESVILIRITVAVLGILAMIFAMAGSGDIIGLLTGAYSIYTPGIIFPLTIAIFAHGKCDIRKPVWLLAVMAGGIFGLMGAYFPGTVAKLSLPAFVEGNLPLIGMGVSLLVGLCSLKKKKA